MTQNVYFYSEKKTDTREILQHLRQHPIYSAFFSRSRLLQFFVVDLKKMGFLPFISGGAVVLPPITLLVHPLQSIMKDNRKEMSIYYMFGGNMYTLKGCYVRHILTLVRRYTIAGYLVATLVVPVFVLTIYMKPPVVVTILLSLFLPLLVFVDYLLLFTLTTHQLVRRICIVEELFRDEKSGDT